jgi:hypothetical protein
MELNDPAQIREFLSRIVLKGEGFTTDSLMGDVMDAGLDYPDFLRAEGEDAQAFYGGNSPAWAKYHIRQGKRVFMVYGGRVRKTHFSETP